MRRFSAAFLTGIATMALLGACARDDAAVVDPATGTASGGERGRRDPIVTISGDQKVSPVPDWQSPRVEVDEDSLARLRIAAAEALAEGELFGEQDDAIPLYLALREHAPADVGIRAGLAQSVDALVDQGNAALAGIDDDPASLRRAQEVAAVARNVAPGDRDVLAYLTMLDRAEAAARFNLQGERALNTGDVGARAVGAAEGSPETGAIGSFREALRHRPGDVRAMQGLAAGESALIRRAELAADEDDYATAERWLQQAASIRPEIDTVAHVRNRIAMQRAARIGTLRDLGITALSREDGIDDARARLADLLRIAPAGDAAARELRERIELATHYGLFRPGQVFTEALGRGGRGPEMVVIPHGAFRMGADAGEPDSTDAERPARNIRFDRGLAMARNEITVGEFRRFVNSTAYASRATRRSYSTVYDERSGNLVRRGGVDWQSDYAGKRAADNMPVVHVSAQDAAAYADWLAEQTGHRYRLPSEAEFEYALRARGQGRYPWGAGPPLPNAGNFTGGSDESPSGRRWRNAFKGYGDGHWGPAPVASFAANAYGLHDLAGNVSEWVADCWHDSYRRAPVDGQPWINPGCRTRVVRGGSWASSPAQTRSAWRLGSDADTTNARVGFRVVREI